MGGFLRSAEFCVGAGLKSVFVLLGLCLGLAGGDCAAVVQIGVDWLGDCAAVVLFGVLWW